MAVVVISSVDERSRRELAECLAKKLGCESISREQMIERATEAGIPLGKLEWLWLKTQLPGRDLPGPKCAIWPSSCRAASEWAMKGNVVYHGRSSHMFFQGIPMPSKSVLFRIQMHACGTQWSGSIWIGKGRGTTFESSMEIWKIGPIFFTGSP